jgi:hypothetical protein
MGELSVPFPLVRLVASPPARQRRDEASRLYGTHDSCRNEDLPDMAEHLQGCLERVQVELVETAD